MTSTDGADIVGAGSTSTERPRNITWRRWGARSAVARAIIGIDPCGCAMYADELTASLTVSLSDPKTLGGHLIFTLMRFSDIHAIDGRHLTGPGIDRYPTVYRISYRGGSYPAYSWNLG